MATAIKSIKKKPPPEVNEGGFDDAALASIQGVTTEILAAERADEPNGQDIRANYGHNSGAANPSREAADKLRQFVAAIETLEEEKKEVGGQIKDKYLEAKAMGYDAKALRAVVRRRAQDRQEREEFEAILDTYELALEHYD